MIWTPSSVSDATKAYVGKPATMAIDSAPSSSVYFEPSVTADTGSGLYGSVMSMI